MATYLVALAFAFAFTLALVGGTSVAYLSIRAAVELYKERSRRTIG